MEPETLGMASIESKDKLSNSSKVSFIDSNNSVLSGNKFTIYSLERVSSSLKDLAELTSFGSWRLILIMSSLMQILFPLVVKVWIYPQIKQVNVLPFMAFCEHYSQNESPQNRTLGLFLS